MTKISGVGIPIKIMRKISEMNHDDTVLNLTAPLRQLWNNNKTKLWTKHKNFPNSDMYIQRRSPGLETLFHEDNRFSLLLFYC